MTMLEQRKYTRPSERTGTAKVWDDDSEYFGRLHLNLYEQPYPLAARIKGKSIKPRSVYWVIVGGDNEILWQGKVASVEAAKAVIDAKWPDVLEAIGQSKRRSAAWSIA